MQKFSKSLVLIVLVLNFACDFGAPPPNAAKPEVVNPSPQPEAPTPEAPKLAPAPEDKSAAHLRSKVAQAYPYALLVDAGYHFVVDKVQNYQRLTQDELPNEWQKWFIPNIADKKYGLGKGELINRKDLAMWAAVFKNDDNNEIVLVLRGSELRPMNLKDFSRNAKTVTQHFLGYLTPHFQMAYELAKDLKEMYPEHKLVITGSSLGGSLSLFAGLALHSRVYAFNSLGLNKKEVEFVEKQNSAALLHADELATVISITGDTVSDSSDMMPKSFVNRYFGTVIKVPFYDQSWSGYYTSNHHTSDAIVKSLEHYLKAGPAHDQGPHAAASVGQKLSDERGH